MGRGGNTLYCHLYEYRADGKFSTEKDEKLGF